MKRKSFISIGVVLFIFYELQIECIAQDITVDFFEPPPGIIDVGSLTTMLRLTNNTAATLDVYIHGDVSEATDGPIAWGESGSFTLQPGIPHFVTLSDVEPYEYHFVNSNPIYEQTVTVANCIPVGIYIYCAKFIDAASGLEFTNTYTCSDPIEATNPVVPELISPPNQEIICNANPLFSWTPTNPLPLNGSGIVYKIKMVQMHEGQSEIEAIQNNPAIFETTLNNEVAYQYPLHESPLQEGQYAWQVQSLLANGITPYGDNNGQSEVFSFLSAIPSPIPTVSYEFKHIVFRLNSLTPTGEITQRSDEPLALKIEGEIKNLLIQKCNCNGIESTKNFDLFSEVEYTWTINPGDNGTFISRNDLELGTQTIGEQVIYMPPEITDLTNTTTIIIHVSAKYIGSILIPGQPITRTGTIKIEMKRTISENPDFKTGGLYIVNDPGSIKDEIEYNISFNTTPVIPLTFPVEINNVGCTLGWSWELDNITVPTIEIPDDIAVGDYIILSVHGSSDIDELSIYCNNNNTCNTAPNVIKTNLPDKLKYKWYATQGSFPYSSEGEKVIWKAPNSECTVQFSLLISDSKTQFNDANPLISPNTKDVYKLGIGLCNLPIGWKPLATNQNLPASVDPRIYIYKGNQWKPTDHKKIITLKLSGISKQKGVCNNFPPPQGSGVCIYPPDLFFRENSSDWFNYKNFPDVNQLCPTKIINYNDNPSHSYHHLMVVSKKRVTSVVPVIRNEDFGAFGILSAQANHCIAIPTRNLPGDIPSNAPPTIENSRIKIPRDDNNNDIADGTPWDALNSMIDNDINPISNSQGDGFTNYEEYRGFLCGTLVHHKRTNSSRKTIFIINDDNLPLAYFYNTNLEVLVIRNRTDLWMLDNNITLNLPPACPDKSNSDLHPKLINYNKSNHFGGNQYGLFLEQNNSLGSTFYGICEGDLDRDPTNLFVPRDVYKVLINKSALSNRKVGIPPQLLPPDKCIRKSVAHELGHGININHHGPNVWHYMVNPAAILTYTPKDLWYNNNEESIDANPILLGYAVSNGVTSGNTNCVMIYDNQIGFSPNNSPVIEDNNQWNRKVDSGEGQAYRFDNVGRWCVVTRRHIRYIYNLPHIIGSQYCSDGIGDNYNALGGANPPGSGVISPRNDATKGNCRSQIKVKCW
jgi:hypothetical protein